MTIAFAGAIGHAPGITAWRDAAPVAQKDRLYAGFASTLVIDRADAGLAGDVEEAGMRCVVAPTVMSGPAEAAALARTVLGASGRRARV